MRVVAAGIAIAFGLLVLLGYFFPTGLLLEIRLVLVQWAVILAAVAVLVGLANLFGVHWEKLRTRQKGGVYSILLILSLIVTFFIGVAPPGPGGPIPRFFLEAVIVPAEGALMALLAVTLIYASARLLRRRVDLMTILFVGVALFVLLAAAPLPFGKIPGLAELQAWLTQVLAAGGARGILLGVALGSLTTGLRVLFGIDRPYGGK